MTQESSAPVWSAVHSQRPPIGRIIRHECNRLSCAAAQRTLTFLTPRRIWSYPCVALSVLVPIVVYKLLSSGEAPIGNLGGDFLSFYTGGNFILFGKAESLLDPTAQRAFQEHLLGPNVESTSLWVSPPFFAWAFVPLARLGFVPALIVLWGMSLVGIAWSVCALRQELGLRLSPLQTLAVWVLHFPTWLWFLTGQMTGIWLATLIWIFVLLRRGRDTLAGLLLGCLACKPQLGLGLAVALLVTRRWRVVAGGCVSALGLVALGFATVPDVMYSYLQRGSTLVALVRSSGYPVSGLFGSFEFATLLLDGIAPRAATALGCVLCLGLLAKIAWLWHSIAWRPGTRAWDLRMASTLSLGVIASPHLYHYDLMLLVLPLFILVAHYPGENSLPLDAGPLLLATIAVWTFSLTGQVLVAIQQSCSQHVIGSAIAVQVGAIAIALWGIRIARAADAATCLQLRPNRVVEV